MKFSVAALLLIGFVAIQAAPQGGSYTTKFDNVNLDEILSNQRLYKKYFDCLANKGKCTPEGKTLKDILPEALATHCKKCTPRQKAGAEKVLKFVIEKKPQDWAVLEKIYDPKGTYKSKYQTEAAKKGIKV